MIPADRLNPALRTAAIPRQHMFVDKIKAVQGRVVDAFPQLRAQPAHRPVARLVDEDPLQPGRVPQAADGDALGPDHVPAPFGEALLVVVAEVADDLGARLSADLEEQAVPAEDVVEEVQLLRALEEHPAGQAGALAAQEDLDRCRVDAEGVEVHRFRDGDLSLLEGAFDDLPLVISKDGVLRRQVGNRFDREVLRVSHVVNCAMLLCRFKVK